MSAIDIVIAYVPVLHAGYVRFFESHAGSQLFLIGPEIYGESFEHLDREIRALSPMRLLQCIKALEIFAEVNFLNQNNIAALDHQAAIVMPDEDVSRYVAARHLPNHSIAFESVFLRFDMPKTMSSFPVMPDNKIAITQFDKEVLQQAYKSAAYSPDWWRQVGAVLVKDGQIYLRGYNQHMPSQHALYAFGDPRNNFVPGQELGLTAALHAEKDIITQAAYHGLSTKGASMYVTTFPCPPCAYDLAQAGIVKLYFCEGYSQLKAQETLRSRNVEIIQIT